MTKLEMKHIFQAQVWICTSRKNETSNSVVMHHKIS